MYFLKESKARSDGHEQKGLNGSSGTCWIGNYWSCCKTRDSFEKVP